MYKTCFNIKDSTVLPFMKGSWVKLNDIYQHKIGKEFKNKLVLKKQCDYKRIKEYLEDQQKVTGNLQNYNDIFERKEVFVNIKEQLVHSDGQIKRRKIMFNKQTRRRENSIHIKHPR